MCHALLTFTYMVDARSSSSSDADDTDSNDELLTEADRAGLRMRREMRTQRQLLARGDVIDPAV